jgi:hypothetical protein
LLHLISVVLDDFLTPIVLACVGCAVLGHEPAPGELARCQWGELLRPYMEGDPDNNYLKENLWMMY